MAAWRTPSSNWDRHQNASHHPRYGRLRRARSFPILTESCGAPPSRCVGMDSSSLAPDRRSSMPPPGGPVRRSRTSPCGTGTAGMSRLVQLGSKVKDDGKHPSGILQRVRDYPESLDCSAPSRQHSYTCVLRKRIGTGSSTAARWARDRCTDQTLAASSISRLAGVTTCGLPATIGASHSHGACSASSPPNERSFCRPSSIMRPQGALAAAQEHFFSCEARRP